MNLNYCHYFSGRFETFLSDTPEEDKDIALRFCESFSSPLSILCISGELGNGVTHLMSSVFNWFQDNGQTCCSVNGEKLVSIFQSERYFFEVIYQLADVLFIDEYDFLRKHPEARKWAKQLIQDQILNGKKVVINCTKLALVYELNIDGFASSRIEEIETKYLSKQLLESVAINDGVRSSIIHKYSDLIYRFGGSNREYLNHMVSLEAKSQLGLF